MTDNSKLPRAGQYRNMRFQDIRYLSRVGKEPLVSKDPCAPRIQKKPLQLDVLKNVRNFYDRPAGVPSDIFTSFREDIFLGRAPATRDLIRP